MTQDSHTEITKTSWISRLGGAFKGMIVGLIFFLISFPLLFNNEGRAVKTHKTLQDGLARVSTVTSEQVDSRFEGRLVHMNGKVVTNDRLTDLEFGVTTNAIKLKRIVSMYQWHEQSQSSTKKKVGGGTETETTYSYRKDWSNRLIKSENFKMPGGHRNPHTMPYQSTTYKAEQAEVGAFRLTPSLIDKMSNYTPLRVSSVNFRSWHSGKRVRIHNGAYYIGTNPDAPEIGDLRISFEEVKPGFVSIVAKQVNNSFAPYKSKTGKYIEMLRTGVTSSDVMFDAAEQSNKVTTWLLRLAGFFLMFVGLRIIIKPLSVFADVLPILGNIVGAGTGIISFLIALVLSVLTIGLAWFFYRPLYGLLLVVLAVILIFLISKKLKKAQAVSST